MPERAARLMAAATEWLAVDPDPETRAELLALLGRVTDGEAEAAADLASRFDGRLEFGTAGLRGEIGAGPARMNRVVVAQTSAGLAKVLLSRTEHPRVVIGYDGRKNSEVFARDAAGALASAGVHAILLPRALPTPVLAFAVRHLETDAGVMITASHNPAADNGYKLYLGGSDAGSQIVPPVDAEVFAAIETVVASGPASWNESSEYDVADDEVLDAYVAATARAFPLPDGDLRWVYTAMHGVGWETFDRVLRAARAPEPALVDAQLHPDPAFPTVAFPNPEEPGALDLAVAVARTAGADLIVANDPDADRLALAVRHDSGEYEQLRGNDIGLLLAASAAARAEADGRHGTLACSIVSTPGLAAVAASHGLAHRETLTGFKWISRAPGLIFGFEEALGYLVDPDKIRDKDGISAALAALQLFLELRRDGVSFAEHRAAAVERYGWFGSDQISIRVADLSDIAATMQRLRAEPPTEIGGLRIDESDDLLVERDGGIPASDVLRYWLEGGARVIIRPSGTEPKLKVYLDVGVTEGDPVDRADRGAATLAQLRAGAEELVGPRD